MVKQCKSCGTVVSGEARFCSKCGGSEFLPYQQPMTPNPYQQANPNPYPGGVPYSPPPPPPKKKGSGGKILLVVILLLALATIGFVAERVFQAQGYGERTEEKGTTEAPKSTEAPKTTEAPKSTEAPAATTPLTTEREPAPVPSVTYAPAVPSTSSQEAVAFHKGSFDGTAYVNDWADIKLLLPSGYVNADESGYASLESAGAQCGAFFISEDQSANIILGFETISLKVSKETYLRAVIQAAQIQTGITFTVAEEYSTVTLGGYSYGKMAAKGHNGYTDFTQHYYLRELDGKWILITVTDSGSEAARIFENSLKKLG